MTEPDVRLVLQVGATRYDRWKEVRVVRSIEQIAGSFELVCADAWALRGEPLPPLVGQRCTVSIADQLVITGFIDAVEPGYNADSHDLILRGRDATADLVDSAARIDGQGWKNTTLVGMARDLCQPFGIAVESTLPETRYRAARISPGETVAEVLQRAAAVAGGLLVSYGDGRLTLTRAGSGKASTPLRRGTNILSGRGTEDASQRFARYQVVGQGSEADSDTPAIAQQVLATATDPGARAGRLQVIPVSDDLDRAKAQQLASWHAANALARSRTAELTVRGWLDGKSPWPLNTLVTVSDDWLRLDGEYLVAGITHRIDDREGQVTALTLAPREAYVPEPIVDPEAA